MTSRVDYCNAVLVWSPRVTTDKLQRVTNSAARVISNTRKFDGGLLRLLMDSSIGSMSLTEYNLSSPCWFIDVFMEWLHCTWWRAAHQRPTLLVVNICGLPVSRSCAIVRTVLVIGVLLLWAHQTEIHCQTVFVIQHWVSIFLGISWRHTFLRNIDEMYWAH